MSVTMTNAPAGTITRRRISTTSGVGAAAYFLRGPSTRAAGAVPRATARKLVTVLFADVSESTALSRAVDLEEWWLVIADVFDDMCEAVSRFGGWVEGFTGDGVMAVFEDAGDGTAHARSACQAALWLRDTMLRRASQVREACGLRLSVRIGANSGEVLTGVLGRSRRCYTASGYEVALAKRMEGLAAPGRVCISESTAKLVGDACELRDLGAFDVKGAPAKVHAFELVAPAYAI
jgi:adenylate cyclase